MRAEARTADRITFKEWLREVANLRKAIKINFRSTEVVRPVLQYLYASQADPLAPVLQYPVILHANVFRSPRSVENVVDPASFVDRARRLFPDATLSLGWTKQITWRQLFQILEYIARLDQPVMLSVRLSVASNSKDQLLWLLGMEKAVSLLIWSDDDDTDIDWSSVAEIRRVATKNRVLYDLNSKHRDIIQRIPLHASILKVGRPIFSFFILLLGSNLFLIFMFYLETLRLKGVY
ncbi:unnamed protein product [Nippostrongylus brasiliensis]|uniref:GP-PDE domain-containing protein n=1 Tax=Nippostrongylus brasiliensis TaxID=27835 RepID=A0A0N4YR17_NIPBR|nr:unnamed protein product [Nippostrongylus brasiliensis]